MVQAPEDDATRGTDTKGFTQSVLVVPHPLPALFALPGSGVHLVCFQAVRRLSDADDASSLWAMLCRGRMWMTMAIRLQSRLQS